jgi:2-C-methyl-D-erythritol 2,4-cyclodiphosphate synthase
MHIISLFFTIFADRMNKGHKQTISTRVISTAFIVLAIAIFKPFSLEVWEWQAYVHLLLLFVLGIFSCFLTEVILRFLVRMPRSYDRGVSYIISRNLRFQFINTPLVALLICLYRHFLLSSLAEENKFSLGNFLETLLIIGFLSFAFGLYWRFKFRSKYLAAELEEIREMNEKLKTSTPKPIPNPSRTEGEVGYSQAQNLSELPSCSGGAGGGFRIGMGYDVHRLVEGRELWMGGIKLEHELGLLGHSDADVLIHAICDAILGAANMRDIGYHFPDTSAETDGMDSKIILKKTIELIATKGYQLVNIDATICAERPKMNPHIPEMQQCMANVIGCDVDAISIKATTTEKLGFTGRMEGISAYAVALIEK